MSRSEEGKIYRQRQRNTMGDIAYKAQEALKRKERRARVRASATSTPAPQPQPEPQPAPQSTQLDVIFEAKKSLAEAKGHTNKRASVEAAYKRIQKLHKYMTGNEMVNFKWVKNIKKIKTFILNSDKWTTIESRIQQFQSLASILKVVEGYEKVYDIYSKQSVSMRKTKEKDSDNNLLTEKEKANILSWAQIHKLNDKDLTKYEASLIGVYTLIAPRRAKDFGLMKVGPSSGTDFNHYTEGKFIFNQFKTVNTFGVQTFNVPAQLVSILNDYIAEERLVNGDFLFGKSKTAPYKSFSSIVSKVFKKYLYKNIGVNVLRHSYVSDFLKQPRSLAERKQTAKALGHSVLTQLSYDRLDLV